MTPDALIAYLCATLFGDQYRLVISAGEATLLVELFVTGDMIPQAIGRRGRMVDVLKNIATAAGIKHGMWVHFALEEE
jgi:predicted RNA-binding protein YlqC (UPF0109 family)